AARRRGCELLRRRRRARRARTRPSRPSEGGARCPGGRRAMNLRADACVIGTGAGGAVVAAELAEGGLDVVVLEQGPPRSAAVSPARRQPARAARSTAARRTRSDHDRSVAAGRSARTTTGVLRVRAPRVVVAAGAIHTPLLLARSGLGHSPALGRNLTVHPAT